MLKVVLGREKEECALMSTLKRGDASERLTNGVMNFFFSKISNAEEAPYKYLCSLSDGTS